MSWTNIKHPSENEELQKLLKRAMKRNAHAIQFFLPVLVEARYCHDGFTTVAMVSAASPYLPLGFNAYGLAVKRQGDTFNTEQGCKVAITQALDNLCTIYSQLVTTPEQTNA